VPSNELKVFRGLRERGKQTQPRALKKGIEGQAKTQATKIRNGWKGKGRFTPNKNKKESGGSRRTEKPPALGEEKIRAGSRQPGVWRNKAGGNHGVDKRCWGD